jgi:hypothetical protein
LRLHNVDMIDVQGKDHLLRKSYLDKPSLDIDLQLESVESLNFIKIKGISDFWKSQDDFDFDSIMRDILSGFSSLHTTFVFLLVGRPKEINVFVGINDTHKGVLSSSLQASYPYINLEEMDTDGFLNYLYSTGNKGGIVTGNPTQKTFGQSKTQQIERLCQGMFGSSWAYFVVAKSMSPFQVSLAHERVLNEIDDVSKFVKVSETGGNLGRESWESTNMTLQRYVDNLSVLEERLEVGRTKGMWRLSGYYLADSVINATKLKNLITSTYNGDDSKPERIRTHQVNNMTSFTSSIHLPGDELPHHKATQHPVGVWDINSKGTTRTVHCFKYVYQTLLTTDDLATFCQIPRKEMPGFYIDQYVEFDVANRRDLKKNSGLTIGKVINGSEKIEPYENLTEEDLLYQMELDDMNRHGLIVGITGGGKSNTSKNLLRKLWIEHQRPFMVIESAKREYWELYNMSGFEDILVFTLGAEDSHSVPYRINPFEKMKGVPLQTHIDYVLSTFKASFELYSPMPHVLETSIYRIYEDRGWDILKNTNKFGMDVFPTLDDLYYKVDVVVDELGYDSRLKSDITAALKARIHSLRVGGKGAMLNTDQSIPIESLLSRPVIMELEDIGDDDVKAFMMGIILVQLYEYRRTKLARNKKFEHLILIEEAHRLLANVSSGGEGGNPRAKSVEFFTNLLAEIRSYGQGFLIADQVPTKLAPDTLKNTNLKIVHRIVMEEDRKLIGQSMNMNEEQIDYISALRRGLAAVYAEGDSRPKLVQMPLIKEDSSYPRETVIQNVKAKVDHEFINYDKKYNFGPACAFCLQKCNHRQTMLQTKELLTKTKLLENSKKDAKKNNYSLLFFEKLFNFIKDSDSGIKELADYNARLCSLNIFFEESDLDESYQRENIIKYMHKYLIRDEH